MCPAFLISMLWLLLYCFTYQEVLAKQIMQNNMILKNLDANKGKGILFGHQDDLAYGMRWYYPEGQSDVKRVTGDYPAIFGWELGGVELRASVNINKVPFTTISDLAIWGHHQGGINTFTWHASSVIDSCVDSWTTDMNVVKHLIPGGKYHERFKTHLNKVANFFYTLKDKHGHDIPFIFRPWHEMDGDWFWWGTRNCTPEEFKTLFRFTVEYLRDLKGLSQMAVAYSPDRNFNNEQEFLTWYPGDDVVDILGMDNYEDFKQENGVSVVIRKLHIVIKIARSKGLLAALTETGCCNVVQPAWFTQKLGAVLNDPIIKKELSYAMVWRNDPEVHFFFPYPGHQAAADAKLFAEQDHIFLLNDYNLSK
jgi:mannan endo-1,4-beta-mannosidase